MIDLAQRVTQKYNEGGPVKIVADTYNKFIRPMLPVREVEYNRVIVQNARLFDSIAPWNTTDRPEYEEGLVRGIRNVVEEGDSVVIIGGGWGVSTVVAGRAAGEEGTVYTFEGSETGYKKTLETLELNENDCEHIVNHVIVSHAVKLRGDEEEKEGSVHDPEELPTCDVLVLDCEGAEVEILERLKNRPRAIVVETHGWLGTPPKTVRSVLESMDYRIISEELAESAKTEFCSERGIHVLVATNCGGDR